jgi:hypothetical protein
MAGMRALVSNEASANPEPGPGPSAPEEQPPFEPDDRTSGVELRPATPPARPRMEEAPSVVVSADLLEGPSGALAPLEPATPEPDEGRASGLPEGAEGPAEGREGTPEPRPDAGTVDAAPCEVEVTEATDAGAPTTPGTGPLGDASAAPEGPQGIDPPLEPAAHVPTHVELPHAAASATPPIARVAFVPEELRSYNAFREAYWSAPGGQFAPVPWRDPAFADRLRARAERMLGEEAPELAWLWLLARAGELLGVGDLLSPADVRALDALRQAPEAPEAGASGERGLGLHEAVRGGAVTPRTVWRWRLLLEVLRPSRDAPMPWPDFDSWLPGLGTQLTETARISA